MARRGVSRDGYADNLPESMSTHGASIPMDKIDSEPRDGNLAHYNDLQQDFGTSARQGCMIVSLAFAGSRTVV